MDELVDGRFELKEPVGTGGMGTVYRARDRETGALVAVKVLHDARPNVVARFHREASVLSRVAHPSIVGYIAHGTTRVGRSYLAMEWLEGEDLSQHLLEHGHLGVAESIGVVRRVCEALAALHARGMVHRDIKPANIFLIRGDKRELRVLDFGLVRVSEGGERLTLTGHAIGTPGYMAPEQVRGDSEIKPAADIFSLGCVLFRCLSGQMPFPGDHGIAVMMKTILDEAQRVQEVRRTVPSAVDDLVARMLSKDASARPEDAETLLKEIATLGDAATVEQQVPRRIHDSITSHEQRIVSVVVATTGAAVTQESVRSPTRTRQDFAVQLKPLRQALARFDARVEGMADGSVVAILSGSDTPMEHAVRAARCALELRAAFPVATLVVATGRALLSEKTPVGEVIDRAANLVTPLAPGRIRLDDLTAGLLDRRFAVGADEAVSYLEGERPGVQVARTLLGKPTSCVGRAAELGLLDGLYCTCAEEPAARAVLVTGAAGVGKSRLRYEFVRRLQARSETFEILLGQADSMSQGTTYGLLAQALRRAAGLRVGEPVEVQRHRLHVRLARHLAASEAEDVTGFLGELVGVPFDDQKNPKLRAAREDPRLMADRVRDAWTAYLKAECGAQPVVLILEDLHWGDQASVQLVDAALRALRDEPLVVLALARPEVHERFSDLWAQRELTELKLGGLSRRACEKLVREVLGEDVSEDAISRVVQRSAGNAFFLEELVRAVADRDTHELPATVAGMVQARLDALDSETRRVLRAGSVYGQVFWAGGVSPLLGVGAESESVTTRLKAAVAHEVVDRHTDAMFPGEVEYGFRHAIVRDTLYETLTERDRTLAHRLAGTWLEEMGARDAAALAEHFERGSEPGHAMRWYLRAAEDALGGHDLEACTAYADRGAACGAAGETLGQLRLVQAEAHAWKGEPALSDERAREAAGLLTPGSGEWFKALGVGILAAGRFGDNEQVTRWLDELRQTPPEESAHPRRIIAICQAAGHLLKVGRHDLVDELVRIGTEAAASLEALPPEIRARFGRVRAFRALHGGDLGAFVLLGDSARDGFTEGGDLRNACLQRVNVGYGFLELGQYARAEEELRAALVDASRLGAAETAAVAEHNLGLALARQGNVSEGLEVEERAVSFFAQQENARFEGASRAYFAEILALAGRHDTAELEALKAVELLAPFPPLRPLALATLALVQMERGRTGEALQSAIEAVAPLDTSERVEAGEARARLLYARALAAAGERENARAAAEAACRRALERADRISDTGFRESFVSHVPDIRQTLDLAEALGVCIEDEPSSGS